MYTLQPRFCEVDLMLNALIQLKIIQYVTGSGKRDIFAHILKIELLAPQGRVSSQL